MKNDFYVFKYFNFYIMVCGYLGQYIIMTCLLLCVFTVTWGGLSWSWTVFIIWINQQYFNIDFSQILEHIWARQWFCRNTGISLVDVNISIYNSKWILSAPKWIWCS